MIFYSIVHMHPTGTNVPRNFAPRMDILGDRCLLVAAEGRSKASVFYKYGIS